MMIKVIYPGRFQPMGRHHVAAYEHLVNKFGTDNVYITTSNKVDSTKSPLNFKEKQRIASLHKIPLNKFIRVKDPYTPVEVTKTFSDNDIVLFAVGKKDMQENPRFRPGKKKDGSPTYFQNYRSDNLKPFTEHGYLYVIPHQSISMKDAEMSGTELRKKLATATETEFKSLMGWFNSKIYSLLRDKFRIDEEVILEGGGAGHMSHPYYHDEDLTFGDMKEIIRRTLSGELNIENDVTEKTDGQNILITYKDNEVKAARNKTQIKNPIDYEELQLKFRGRGPVERAFMFAMRDLERALQNVPDTTLSEIFQEGKRFINLEIIYPETKNVIAYGNQAYLQFHGLLEFDDNARVVDTFPEYGKKLQRLIANVNSDVQETFKIIPPKVLQVEKHQDYGNRLIYYINKIEKIQRDFQLDDSDRIGLWYEMWWGEFIDKSFPDLAPESKTKLIQRWTYDNKEYRIDSNLTDDPDYLDDIKSLDKSFVKTQNMKIMEKFQDIFLELGTEVLENLNDVLAVSKNETIRDIKNNLSSTLKQVQKTGDINLIDKAKIQLRRLQSAGGIDKVVPIEGLVFVYNGKTYKLTGTFAPVNQILGLLKYVR